MIKRDGEELVRPARDIKRSRFAVAIHHVVKIAAVRKPKTLVE